MDQHIPTTVIVLFPLAFVAMWLGVTSMLGAMSGWFTLVAEFPDRSEGALLMVNGQSGTMGNLAVGMNGILDFSVCPSGLRVGINRIFGPFSRPFFVPWGAISVERRSRIIGPAAVLRFGSGRLTMAAYVADRLARASEGKWPEPGPFHVETPAQAFKSVFREWAVITVFASAFFIIAPRLLAASAGGPPIIVAVLFPAVFFGVVSAVRFARRIAR